MRAPRLRLSPPALLAALLLHGLLFIAWQAGSRSPISAPTAGPGFPRIELRILPPDPATDLVRRLPPRQTVRPEPAARSRAPASIIRSTIEGPTSVPRAASPDTDNALQGIELGHPAPEPIDTRRAARDAIADRSVPARMAIEAGEAWRDPGAAQALAGGVLKAARGDCAKGHFAGGGMGLLSLPFLAAAALRDDCAR